MSISQKLKKYFFFRRNPIIKGDLWENPLFPAKSHYVIKTNVQLRLRGMFLASHYGRVYSY